MLHLLKLYPEQVSRQWDSIVTAIESALPAITPNTLDRMNRVFESILAGLLNVYVFHDENKKLKGIVSVAIIESVDGVARQLLLYSLYGYRGVTMEQFNEGFELLRELARGLNCESIIAYSTVPSLIEYVKRVGGDASQTFLRMEV